MTDSEIKIIRRAEIFQSGILVGELVHVLGVDGAEALGLFHRDVGRHLVGGVLAVRGHGDGVDGQLGLGAREDLQRRARLGRELECPHGREEAEHAHGARHGQAAQRHASDVRRFEDLCVYGVDGVPLSNVWVCSRPPRSRIRFRRPRGWPAVHAGRPAAAAQRPEHRAARDARDGARRGADPTNAAQGCYLSR